MTDPTIKRASVVIKYTGSDGYRSEVRYSNHGALGNPTIPPENVLLEAIDELARLSELFGFGAKALDKVQVARQRVQEWRVHLDAPNRASDAIATGATE